MLLSGFLTLAGIGPATPDPANAVAPSYYPSGPQRSIAKSTVTGGGWELCYSGTFAVYGTTLETRALAESKVEG